MSFYYSKTDNLGASSLVAFRPDGGQAIYQATASHPYWEKILKGLDAGDPNVWALFDVLGAVKNEFRQVTDRVSFDGSSVLFDGDPIHSLLATQVERTIKYGEPRDYRALALFWEKLESNPEKHSREQAFDWLAAHNFQITAEGDLVGYKGMIDKGDGLYESTAGSQVKGKPSAYVNGQPIKELSRVPQRIGDVVSMPRSEVVHDPRQSCKRGLHVATHDYAKTYGVVMEVIVNPRDICSVPTADRGQKVRVNRYVNNGLARKNDSLAPVLRAEHRTEWVPDVGTRV